jgi:hypothetical protein
MSRSPAQDIAAQNALTAAEHLAAAQAAEVSAAESFERSDTDGCLSQWASDITGRLHRLQAQLVENGSMYDFDALFDLDGNLVAAKLLTVADRFRGYGTRTVWGVLESDDPDSRIVKWITAFPARTSTMERKGYREGVVRAKAYAHTSAPAGATGLSGCLSVGVSVSRQDGGFSRDVEIVDNGMPDTTPAPRRARRQANN